MSPARTCVGCRRKRPQPALVRLVSDGSGGLVMGRNLPGRGAWLCADTAAGCFTAAQAKKALARALRAQVRGDAVVDGLSQRG